VPTGWPSSRYRTTAACGAARCGPARPAAEYRRCGWAENWCLPLRGIDPGERGVGGSEIDADFHIEDIYELTYIRKDGSRFPAVVSVTALRDGQGGIIGYLLIGTDNTARKQAEEALLKAGALQNAIFNSATFSSIATDEKGVIQLFNVGAERMLGYTALEVVDKITPADISDPQEVIARAKELSLRALHSDHAGLRSADL
jgi:PAS domain-containing protein